MNQRPMTVILTALPFAFSATLALAMPAAASPELGDQILADSGIDLLDSHVGGQDDPDSTARQNIEDTAAGNPARTSPWSDVGVTDVTLSDAMLTGMVELGKTFDYRVTTIAGGDHSSTSYHYAGTAVDIDQINGTEVEAGNPLVDELMTTCTDLGAVEVLGPGDEGHDTHIHCAWDT